MTRKDFYNISRIAARIRRLLFKKLGIQGSHSGLCGMAAIPLCVELRKKKYACFVVFGHVKVDKPKEANHSHYWVEIDGYIVDITGDRFNEFLQGQKLPGVVIAPYALMPRYKPDRKDAIPLADEDKNDNFLKEWMETC